MGLLEKENIVHKINYVTRKLEQSPIDEDASVLSNLWKELKDLYKQLKDLG